MSSVADAPDLEPVADDPYDPLEPIGHDPYAGHSPLHPAPLLHYDPSLAPPEPPPAATPTLSDILHPGDGGATLSATTPTLRERLGQVLEGSDTRPSIGREQLTKGLLGTTGLGSTSNAPGALDVLALPIPGPGEAGAVSELGRAGEALPTLEGKLAGDIAPLKPPLSAPPAPPIMDVPTIAPSPRAYGDPYAPSASGSELRISTRLPNDAPDVHQTADYTVGMDALEIASDRFSQNAYAKNAQLIRDHPGVPIDPNASDAEAYQQFQQHLVDNLTWLYHQWPEETRARASQWYDGANAISNRWAAQYGQTPQGVAGAIAAMSPQKDWMQNADLAGRMLDIRTNQASTVLTPEMRDYVNNVSIPEALAPGGPEAAAKAQDLRDTLKAVQNVPFGAINDPETRARWLRWYDEAHNDRSYPSITPEGQFGDPVLNADGTPRKVGWGSNGEIMKAMSALDDSSVPNISEQMGDRHKVRNFYNNIVSPMSDQGDVTIDTHAVAAALARPLSQASPEVTWGLGGGGGAANGNGSLGLYPVYADAYRQAARQLGVLPRQLQSITWEQGRQLFTPGMKRNPDFVNGINAIHDAVKNGALSTDDARNYTLEQSNLERARLAGSSPASGLATPLWDRPHSEEDD
jgi:hypothetical protein